MAKVLVHDPIAAAKATGGCTFEPFGCGPNGIVGWWTFTPDPALAVGLGEVFDGARDAIYLPTIRKDGVAVAGDVVENLKARARALGLQKIAQAAGMWVLSDDDSIPAELRGTIQAETIWIYWSREPTDRAALAALAEDVKVLAAQDCVAREEAGELVFTG